MQARGGCMTFLVGQYRFPLKQYSWKIPEGGGPLGIDPLDSAKRELKEKTGLVEEESVKLLHLHLSTSVTDEYRCVFLARNVRQEEAMPEETEQLVVRKVSFEEACQMVENGTITDTLAVTAILKVKLLLLHGKLPKNFGSCFRYY